MHIWHQLLEILGHTHPHLLVWFRNHRGDGYSVRHFVHIVHHYPRTMHHLLHQRHYCHWLYHFILGRDGLPSDDLLLGA